MAVATAGRALRSPSPIIRSADRCCWARRRRPGSARRRRLRAQSGNTPATNASGLSTFAIDAQCNIATEYKLFYRTTNAGCSSALPDPSPPAAPPTNNCFKPYTPGSAPADLATTTTTAGLTVPYIVRVERGTINRGIYDIAVLFDPSKPWSALSPQAQWNGKVVYSFGASTGQPRLQFRTEQNWADNAALSRGFMVVDNSLTDSLYNSNRVLNAETLMMMKEHIADTYGEITYTLGNGCSGGSIQQNTAASIYPGLLDGIQPSCDYPDSITTGLEVLDCVSLVNFYARPGMDGVDDRPHAGADQCQEDRDQRPSRPARLPLVEQRVRPQQQAGQLRAGPGRQLRHRRAGAGRRAAQQLPAARRAGLRPGDQSERHALRRRRPRHRRLGHDERHRSRQRARAANRRQRRHSVWPEGTDGRCDHAPRSSSR